MNNINNSKKSLPKPTVERLCKLYGILKTLKKDGEMKISSTKIATLTGISAHTIRKDLNCFGETGKIGAGYEVEKLLNFIGNELNLNTEKNICIVGLGRIGTAILSYNKLKQENFNIVAAFDSSTNKIETYKTDIPLYPAYRISEIVKEKNIETAILAVPADVAYETGEKLIKGGIKGIINFSPAPLNFTNINIRNMDIVEEMRFLSALNCNNQ